ncbi:MAG: hypothetical protein AAFX87_03040 [Bacteroidota bacterium]
MTIDFTLVCLQTIFLMLYGMNGMVESIANDKRRWIATFAAFLMGSMFCIFLENHVKSNIQLILLLLLGLDYLIHLRVSDARSPGKTLVSALIAFMAYSSMHFQLELNMVWLVVPFFLVANIGIINKWPDFLTNLQEYFLKAGALITLLFMLEPVAISVQQNLKPVATIPISSIINTQNFLLLGALLVLVLGGFLWKEKLRP